MNKAKNIIDTDVSFENLVLASIGKKPTHANKKGKVSPLRFRLMGFNDLFPVIDPIKTYPVGVPEM
ncbi:hypothetical protein AP064_04090 [Candidatus Liberibacter solanacearum]|uniref:Uncharacterized protein n=1 Tax=Candidatus Liberibacter solanacearum TaxID=556287 RepID=A0A0F4VKJ3_9HYPH|nr:hypothetical protein KP07_01750 [Candidatus Liberibacter solanacearum]KJZ81704.1 hypothetical protein DJ66_0426 [Candidatus Liberibacter solanacearum]KQC48967.1 hypothetical protein AP064_04090 [Candidatus Liberibacter solanacearum]